MSDDSLGEGVGWFAYDVDGQPPLLAKAFAPDNQPRTIEGPVSLFLDDCIDFPLWEKRGPIEETPEWLHENLGLSFGLIDELARLLDRYYNGTNTKDEEEALWRRVQAELKPHLG